MKLRFITLSHVLISAVATLWRALGHRWIDATIGFIIVCFCVHRLFRSDPTPFGLSYFAGGGMMFIGLMGLVLPCLALSSGNPLSSSVELALYFTSPVAAAAGYLILFDRDVARIRSSMNHQLHK